MTIQLYANKSEPIAVDKDIELLTTKTGALRGPTSLMDPVIEMGGIDSIVGRINYAYIPEFGRYYFVSPPRAVITGMWELSMHVDVLSTYEAGIRANHAIIERNENEYDLKLNDGLFQTQQNPRIMQYPFPNGFSQFDFVLAVAGN